VEAPLVQTDWGRTRAVFKSGIGNMQLSYYKCNLGPQLLYNSSRFSHFSIRDAACAFSCIRKNWVRWHHDILWWTASPRPGYGCSAQAWHLCMDALWRKLLERSGLGRWTWGN